MWRDRWFRVGGLGTLVACLVCVTPAAALILAAIGLAGWAGMVDVVFVPALVGFAALAAYRAWRVRRMWWGSARRGRGLPRGQARSSRHSAVSCRSWWSCWGSAAAPSWWSRCSTAGSWSRPACSGSCSGSCSTRASAAVARSARAAWPGAGWRSGSWLPPRSWSPAQSPSTSSRRSRRTCSRGWLKALVRARGRVTTWSRGLPWLTVALVLLLLSAASATTSTVLLAVEGMTWGTWPLAVKRALEGLKGVARADVSFRDKAARVAYDPAQVTVEQMIAAVNGAGFRASVKRQAE